MKMRRKRKSGNLLFSPALWVGNLAIVTVC